MNERNPHFPSTLTEWGGGGAFCFSSAYLFLSSYIFSSAACLSSYNEGGIKKGRRREKEAVLGQQRNPPSEKRIAFTTCKNLGRKRSRRKDLKRGRRGSRSSPLHANVGLPRYGTPPFFVC